MMIAGIGFRDDAAPLWAGAASAIALALALGSQYWGGLEPCELCLWQRVPYGVAVAAAVGALLWFRSPRERMALTWLAALCFAAGAAVALYHVGVELHWVAGPASCSGSASLNDARTVEELRRLLAAAPVARCDVVAWSLFGISMAGWNALASLALLAGCGLAGWRLARGTGS